MIVGKLLECSPSCPLADHIILAVVIAHLCLCPLLRLFLLSLPTLIFDLFPTLVRWLQPVPASSLTISFTTFPYRVCSSLPQLPPLGRWAFPDFRYTSAQLSFRTFVCQHRNFRKTFVQKFFPKSGKAQVAMEVDATGRPSNGAGGGGGGGDGTGGGDGAGGWQDVECRYLGRSALRRSPSFLRLRARSRFRSSDSFLDDPSCQRIAHDAQKRCARRFNWQSSSFFCQCRS